jgi:diguanylate cyclase (GGDEF)-like protein
VYSKKLANNKVHSYYRRYFIIIAVIWITSLLFLSYFSYTRVAKNIKEQLGNKAMLLAKDISQRFVLKEKDFNELLRLDFNKVLQHPINKEFEKDIRSVIKDSDIKYVYLEVPLIPSQVKYTVEAGEEEIYNAKLGTPLQVIYLLDAVISDEVRLEDTNGKWYVDKDRYNVMDKKFYDIYESKKTSYHIVRDRWGNYITGYAPFYDDNGNYIGLIGVDIFIKKYNKILLEYSIWICGFILINLIIGIMATHLWFRVKSAEKYAKEKDLLSALDDLTSILNRRKFMEIFEDEWKKGIETKESLSLFLIDVDYFKEYNDNYGHLKGDELLKKIAFVLKHNVKKYGGYVARYGGDEFIVLLTNIDIKQSEKIGNNIVEALYKLKIEHKYSKISNYQTVSIGLANMIPTQKTFPQFLFSYADKALYKAKHYGRNRICVWKKQSFN